MTFGGTSGGRGLGSVTAAVNSSFTLQMNGGHAVVSRGALPQQEEEGEEEEDEEEEEGGIGWSPFVIPGGGGG